MSKIISKLAIQAIGILNVYGMCKFNDTEGIRRYRTSKKPT
jgi:hypothetical protein